MKQIIISALFVAVTTLAVAQEKKNEVSLVGGAANMDMNGDYGVATNLQYTRWFEPYFGAEARLGLVRYNDFPSFSNYAGGGQPWKVSEEFDTYILNMDASKAFFVDWSSTTFFAGEVSAVVSPVHTAHHRLKLFAGVTRQYRSVSMMTLIEFTASEDETIERYTPGYIILNLAEWGKHYGVAYQYLLDNDWSVGATAKLTYMNLQRATIGHSDHVLFGLSVGRAF
ncbi:MAG: hypothetical protein WA960_09020 [Tunicatimonas sp.]